MGSESASLQLTAARILYRLVSIPSPTGEEERAARAFVEEARRLGLDAWTDSIGNAYAAPPGSGRRASILLAGHIDTVEGWIEPRMENGVVVGRGAVDAKGPLAAMLAAIAAVANANPSAPVAVAALVGEEGDSRGAWHLVKLGGVPGYVVVGEPTGGTGVAVGYRGSVKLTVECHAIGGHTSSPWAGESALDKLVELIVRVRSELQRPDPSRPIASIPRVEAGSACNVLPTTARACVDVRVPPGMSVEEAVESIASLLPEGCSYRVVGEPTPPVRVPVSSPVPRALVRALLRQGLKPRPVVKTGTSDMNILAGHTRSIAAYGPGDPSLAHTLQERITVEELAVGVETYRLALLELLQREEGLPRPVRLPEE